MSALVTAVVGSAAISAYSARKQGKAAQAAAKQQAKSADAGIAEQQRQFDAIQELLKPYVQGGAEALEGQQSLVGLNGIKAQRRAIEALQASPAFTSALQQGENAILQNAAATGGLRGGNTQSALMEFRPALLAQTISDQYGRLGALTTLGQNSAVQQANFGQQTGNNVGNLLQQQGAALAGGQLAKGQQYAGYANAIGGALGMYGAMGGKF